MQSWQSDVWWHDNISLIRLVFFLSSYTVAEWTYNAQKTYDSKTQVEVNHKQLEWKHFMQNPNKHYPYAPWTSFISSATETDHIAEKLEVNVNKLQK